MSGGYVAIDFETTGLFPQKHDRVVEVAVVEMDSLGTVENEWVSLINPQRDVGPTHIHGIRARDVLDAPTFSDVAPRLLQSIRGRTMVAHNAPFDLRFLDYELGRAGWPDPRPFSSVCTMSWSKHFLVASSRRLTDCCAAMGVELTHAHEAMNDARAVAALLQGYLAATHPDVLWGDAVTAARRLAWPNTDGHRSDVLCPRGNRAPTRPSGWLDRIVARMPRRDDLVESYLDVLETALLDRYLSAHEERQLVELASTLGLSRRELDVIHLDYVTDLAAAALADGVVTDQERTDLDAVADLLGFTEHDVDRALTQVEPAPRAREGFSLSAGDVICLTGSMSRPRNEIEALVESVGVECSNLTRRTKVLVAADPDSLSGKAKKARDYGIPVIHEVALWSYLLQLAGRS